ncbi:hypothetical protein [Planococcus shenhongbingii]|uniref:Uncharacterized protein n=1 Tax=Planococcus shenhongbingii TaxID=3058398 RepID=A0ABT8NHA2_9BACL|nr:hypothetical protein [Planococcus sp. N017]MDN7247099.1 hypothetical protein [Planococcus sp. N017]
MDNPACYRTTCEVGPENGLGGLTQAIVYIPTVPAVRVMKYMMARRTRGGSGTDFDNEKYSFFGLFLMKKMEVFI